ncbi:hypothetical protein ABIB85_007825 [Bradyrhizobium sp. JR1.5]
MRLSYSGCYPPERRNGSTDPANRSASCTATAVDCFSEGREPIESTASQVPAERTAITIAARYSVLMEMVPSSPPEANRTLSEMVPTSRAARCLRPQRKLLPTAPARLVAPRFPPSEWNIGVAIRKRERKPSASFRNVRPPLAGTNTAHVADSQRLLTRFSLQALAQDSQKRRSPVPFKIASRAPIGCGESHWADVGVPVALFLPRLRHAQPYRHRLCTQPGHGSRDRREATSVAETGAGITGEP